MSHESRRIRGKKGGFSRVSSRDSASAGQTKESDSVVEMDETEASAKINQYISGTWVGKPMETYHIARQKGFTWACEKVGPAKGPSKHYTIIYTPGEEHIRWGKSSRYYVTISELAANPKELHWYDDTGDCVKPQFRWHRSSDWCLLTESHIAGSVEESSLPDADTEGQLSTRDCSSIASASSGVRREPLSSLDDSASTSSEARKGSSEASAQRIDSAECFTDDLETPSHSEAGCVAASRDVSCMEHGNHGVRGEQLELIQDLVRDGTLTLKRAMRLLREISVAPSALARVNAIEKAVLEPATDEDLEDDAIDTSIPDSASTTDQPAPVACTFLQIVQADAEEHPYETLEHASDQTSAKAKAKSTSKQAESKDVESESSAQGARGRISTANSEDSEELLVPLNMPQHGLLEYQILTVFSATDNRGNQLVSASQDVAQALLNLGLPAFHVVLYGSLSLPRVLGHSLAGSMGDLRKSYATNISDVDIAIYAPDTSMYHNEARQNAPALSSLFLQGALQRGWRHVSNRAVPRLSVTQWNLINQYGLHLDLTCISCPVRFAQFKERQAGFHKVFYDARSTLQDHFALLGILAFDAYIYLLKAFAVYVQQISSDSNDPYAAIYRSNPLTSFQSVCIGLFVLKKNMHQHSWDQPPTALGLFHKFLIFVKGFFAEKQLKNDEYHFRRSALDLCRQCSALRRSSHQGWRAELYFGDVERVLQTERPDWHNVLHNADGEAICKKAKQALAAWYRDGRPQTLCHQLVWGCLGQDLIPLMKPSMMAAAAAPTQSSAATESSPADVPQTLGKNDDNVIPAEVK